jgi:hypothetical protein
MNFTNRNLRRDKRAVSPAFSTIILTAAGIVLILVALSYANGVLNTKMAENEFSMNKQFMRATGMQIDDIAWTIGRTQTVTYSAKFGQLSYQPATVNYTFQVHTSAGWENFTVSASTGILMYDMPVSAYSMGNNYFQRIPVTASGSFLQNGSSAPVSQVFCVEKMPMSDGAYIRLVAVPTIRLIVSSISSTGQNYYNFYLPIFESGVNPYKSQSLTLTGNGINRIDRTGVDQVKITTTFPSSNFNNTFFQFASTQITLNSTTNPKLAANSVCDFYLGKVMVTIGQV